ncbi:MAG: cytochrome b/b6 domain-containing protein [Proteobacteria bacterium]|nr:cytochrome b/b6 domain-containing protein [Pseudomonadota bacterium]MBS0493975.1 cytochrome b/b6 domain-containing protein [Pseudomonadota bacterium]
MRVWDAPVRLLHWGQVAAVALAWWCRNDTGPLHERTGYVAIALLLARLLWGRWGSRYARFAQFVRSPRATLAYAQAALVGNAPRYIGHNPLGGAMVLALLANLGALGFTGWLYTTDLFWGYGWLASLHQYLAWLLLALVALHVAGMLWTCWQHRENLVRAMITGEKMPPSGDDVA